MLQQNAHRSRSNHRSARLANAAADSYDNVGLLVLSDNFVVGRSPAAGRFASALT
jgi:hypothetical protein